MCSVRGTKIPRRVLSLAQIQGLQVENESARSGKTLLTPKSVNDTMNTKVQRCWVTPSQPSEAYVDGDEDEGEEEDEKAKVTVGNKWELTNNQQSTINNQQSTHWHVDMFELFASSLIVILNVLAFIKTAGLTWCLPALNSGVQCISLLTLVSVTSFFDYHLCSTCNP